MRTSFIQKLFVCLHREAALVIVNNENWKMALRNSTFDGANVTTPLRKMIKKIPGKEL